jgi:FtsZ-interacting cell division protein ZipA
MSLTLRAFVGIALLALAAPAAAGAYVECSYCTAYGRQQNEEAVRRNEEKEKSAEEQKAAEGRRAAEEHSQHEATERQHHEELERSEKERLEKEESERKRTKEEVASLCVVPSLKGDSLSGARAVLGKAHCELGSVVVAIPRRYHGHSALVVRGQGLKRGTRHPNRTAVAVTLGPAR